MGEASSLSDKSPREVRLLARSGQLTGPTCGLAAGFLQANLVVVPAGAAADFRLFCDRNPRPCPFLEMTAPGETGLRELAAGVDLGTDLPRYRVYRGGRVAEEPSDVSHLWRDDLVSFLLGCSFTFEEAMLAAGLPVRHIEEGRNVPMYRTSIPCEPAGPFRGNMVVSMRPLEPGQVAAAAEISARYPFAHGGPVQVGEPESIGIGRIDRPDFGDAVTMRPGEVPVFWACGVTPQEVVTNAGLDLAITHSPGCMFVTDVRAEDWLARS